jgi:hypothetical protein
MANSKRFGETCQGHIGGAKANIPSDGSGEKNVVRAFTCHTLPMFTLEDCNFAAVVEAHLLQKKLVDKFHVQVMDYHRFRKEDFAGDGPLRIGLFSGDIRSHPMMSLLHAFFKYSHPLRDIHVTLYHVSSDLSISIDFDHS